MLHYNKLDRKIDGGEVALLDVAGRIRATRLTGHADASGLTGKFSPRQREIYEIVLGAQNAALAALKLRCDVWQALLQKIAMDYINSHGKDKEWPVAGPILHSRA